jgi:DNA modification methylase
MKLSDYLYHQDSAGEIYCGDCLEILPLLSDNSVDLVLTDPPYGVSYKTTGEEYMVGDTVNLTPYILPRIRKVLQKNGACYLFSSTTKLVEILPVFSIYFKLHSIIIWDKIIGRIPRQLSHYKLRYEPILYGSTGLHRLNGYVDDVIACQIDRGHRRVHPTQKPVNVIKFLIENSSNESDTILDPFLGSGTTAVAAKQLGRKFIGIEIEEKYCEIAKQRLSQEELAL